MKKRILSPEMVKGFCRYLEREERSNNTVKKYVREAERFLEFSGSETVDKNRVILYKESLLKKNYAPRSVNCMLAGINSFLSYLKWDDLKVKPLRLQRETYAPEEKEITKAEYVRLCKTAERTGNLRLSLIMQTICSTGIRVSELPFITVEAVRRGMAVVSLKGKTRKVFIPGDLQIRLLQWIYKENLENGSVFITRSGKAISRSNVWREMKNLCKKAHVDKQKIFPHNFRHLFARVFYDMDKDLAKLADILGHSSIETTRIYIVSSGEKHRKLLDNMHLVI